MNLANSIDTLLAPAAKNLSHCADDLLDLREALVKRQMPGDCIACFYRLMGKAERKHNTEMVEPIKNWLETHLEIVAEDDKGCELERFPVILEGADLEQYCHKVMATIYEDRSYQTPHISLTFAYRGKAA